MKPLRLRHLAVLSPLATICMLGAWFVVSFTGSLAWGLALFAASLALLALALWVNRFGR